MIKNEENIRSQYNGLQEQIIDLAKPAVVEGRALIKYFKFYAKGSSVNCGNVVSELTMRQTPVL